MLLLIHYSPGEEEQSDDTGGSCFGQGARYWPGRGKQVSPGRGPRTMSERGLVKRQEVAGSCRERTRRRDSVARPGA